MVGGIPGGPDSPRVGEAMSGLYRRRVKGRDGKARLAASWTVEFRTGTGRLCRLAAFKDKRASAELAATVDTLLACRAAQTRPDSELVRKVERLPFRVLDRLREWDVLDPRYSGSLKPLAAHLDEWESSMLAAGRTEHHVGVTVRSAREVIDALGWAFWSDVDAAAVENHLAKLRTEGRLLKNKTRRKLSVRRSNAMLQAVRQFARWMVRENRAAVNPLLMLTPLNVETDRRKVRRAMTLDELRRLLVATETGAESFGMTGTERGLVYRLAAESGLRASELRSLTRASFDLDGRTVDIEAKHAKNRRRDTLPLRAETAERLRAHLQRKVGNAPAFGMPDSTKTAAMIRVDLDAAGVALVDEAGRVLDFHALRHTCATLLRDANVPLTTAQGMMRHSTPTLTAKVYTTRFRETEAAAVERLPSFDCDTGTGSQTG